MGWIETIGLAIKGVMELVSMIKGLISLMNQAKREGWINEGNSLATQIKEAKTDEERKALIRRLVGHDGSPPLA